MGMKWKPDKDVSAYSFVIRPEMKSILLKTHTSTKIKVLRIVMNLFDPLGLFFFFLIHGRILLQEIWAAGIGWNETIHESVNQQWRRWIDMLPRLSELNIPRCYFNGCNYESYNNLEVHIFVDASKSAHAAVAYFRAVIVDKPMIALVAAKAKVAPLKLMSVPRLELQEECWPAQKLELYTTNNELRGVNIHAEQQQMVAIERFSRWEKLVGSIARIHWLIKYLKHKCQDKFHRRYKHGNRESVVNELRQQYYVPKLRALIARVL
uniref:Uncharacterized protein n=1 Tax=Anopheles arabiensis TaxID=7173 RepID=A0A182I5D8_ANOAR